MIPPGRWRLGAWQIPTAERAPCCGSRAACSHRATPPGGKRPAAVVEIDQKRANSPPRASTEVNATRKRAECATAARERQRATAVQQRRPPSTSSTEWLAPRSPADSATPKVDGRRNRGPWPPRDSKPQVTCLDFCQDVASKYQQNFRDLRHGGQVTPFKDVEWTQRSIHRDAARRDARFGLEVGAIRRPSLRRRSRGRICPSFILEGLLA